MTGARHPVAVAATFASLVPGCAAAEMFGDVPDAAMFPAEAAAIAGAVAERRREFATVRACARAALASLGLPDAAILPDADGAPRWPAGVVGSMTHCPGFRAAVVARARGLSGVGIDAEPHAPVPEAALDLILRDEERARVAALSAARPDIHWDRVFFSAKEAVYKAWFPLARQWLDFTDLSVSIGPGGRFRARLVANGSAAPAFDGRWMVARDLVLAASTTGAAPAMALAA